MAENNYIPVVIAFTPNYIVPAATTVISILDSSSKTDNFEFICLLNEGLSQEQKDNFELLDIDNRCKFRYLLLNIDLLDGINIDTRYSAAAYFRLLLPELLSDYDKIIYTDCDVIFRNNLSQIYNTDITDKYIAAVYESPLRFQEERISNLGIEKGKYFNSGVLLMNLKKMRCENLSQQMIKNLKAIEVEFPDQDVLNICCKGKIQPLPPYFNSIRTFFLPQYKDKFLEIYTQQDLQKVSEYGNIHYTGEKPWKAFTVEFDIWWKHFDKLPNVLKKQLNIDKKLYHFYKFYSNPIGKLITELTRKIYRLIK